MTYKNIITVLFSLFVLTSFIHAQQDSTLSQPDTSEVQEYEPVELRDSTTTVKHWSLERCIKHSLENNLTVKRQMLNVDIQENQLKQSKRNRLPDLNADLNAGLSYGRTWVQQASQNVDEATSYFNPGISSSISIFQGLQISNTIKKEKFDLLSSIEATNKTKNDITVLITSQFLQILFDKELLAVAKEQYETSKLQVERSKKLVDAGSVAQGDLLEIKSQAAKEALNVTQQENNLMVSTLNLAQLLDIERPIGFDIITPEMPEIENFITQVPNTIYDQAIEIMPEIKKAQYDLTSSEYELKTQKGNFYPTLAIGVGMNSRSTFLIDDKYDNVSLSEQLDKNQNTYIGAQLRIPIFNRLRTRTTVANAKINIIDAQYKLQVAKLDLMKEIQQAYVDASGAYNKYLSSLEAVESFKESFRYTEQRFNVGLVNSVDYNVAKTDYTRAQSNLLQAKYEYVLRTKILDFYNGIPIELK